MKTALTLAALLWAVTPLAAQSLRLSPEQKKTLRDQLASHMGPGVVRFVQRHGDVGLAALKRCSVASGKRLLVLDESGDLDSLPADKLLALVARHGDPLADYLAANHEALTDETACMLFCQSPMDFVYDLKDLDDAVRQARPPNAHPKDLKGEAAPPGVEKKEFYKEPVVWLLGAGVAVIGVLVYLRKKPAEQEGWQAPLRAVPSKSQP